MNLIHKPVPPENTINSAQGSKFPDEESYVNGQQSGL